MDCGLSLCLTRVHCRSRRTVNQIHRCPRVQMFRIGFPTQGPHAHSNIMTIFFDRGWEMHFMSVIHLKSPVWLWMYLNVCTVTFKELQHQVAEQRKLLQSVANFGEELLNNQTTLNGDRYPLFSGFFLNSRLKKNKAQATSIGIPLWIKAACLSLPQRGVHPWRSVAGQWDCVSCRAAEATLGKFE